MRRRTVVLLALVAGAVVLATAGQTWITASGLAGGATAQARATGADAAPVATAMALVVMAAALALTTARRLGARIVAALLALSGAVIASTAATAALQPARTAASAVSAITGTTAPAASYAVTAWPWVCAAAGLSAVLLAAATLVSAGSWTSARRYETAPGTPEAGTDVPAADSAAARRTHGAVAEEPMDEMDAWDDLTRGHDPT